MPQFGEVIANLVAQIAALAAQHEAQKIAHTTLETTFTKYKADALARFQKLEKGK